MRFINLNYKNGTMQISKLVLGTDYFGTNVTEETSLKLLDVYIDAGGNCIDTARVYAEWLPGGSGASEKLIGKWLRSRGCRDNVIISTKGGHPPLNDMTNGRLSRQCIVSDLDESLKAMGTDYIDIYWVHRDEITRPVEEIMETLSALVTSGKVRAVGCSNWSVERLDKANAYAIANGLAPFCASQIQWSLATSSPDAHNDPTIVCMDHNEYTGYLNNKVPVMAYSSQAKGFFTRAAAHGLDAINRKALERFCTQDNIERLERVKAYSAQNNLTPTAVALGYILCNSVEAVAIIGCKNLQQLEDSLTASDVVLPIDVVDWLFEARGRF